MTPASDPSVRALFARVARRLERPEAWTKGAYARDCDGKPASHVFGETDVCWCLAGAIDRERPGSGLRAAEAYAPVLERLGGQDIGRWNDHPSRSHAEVLALVRSLAGDATGEP